MKLVFLMIISALMSAPAFADKEVGNGGDPVIQEFQAIGRDIVAALRRLDAGYLKDLLELTERSTVEVRQMVEDIATQIESATITVSNKPLYRDSQPVIAKNYYPSENMIEVYREGWNDYGKYLLPKYGLVIHEYAGLIGLELNHYEKSTRLFSLLRKLAIGRGVERSNAVKAVALGDWHGCALVDGEVSCWGMKSYGRLGIAEVIEVDMACTKSVGRRKCDTAGDYALAEGAYSLKPERVVGLPRRIKQIVASGNHTCALDVSNQAWCWGALANGTFYFPRAAERSDSSIKKLVASPGGACAMFVSGDLGCLDGRLTSEEQLRFSDPLFGAKSVLHGWSRGIYCAADDTSTISCRRLYDYWTDMELVFPKNFAVKKYVIGWYHACALLNNGKVSCWGDNRFGQLGIGTNGGTSNKPRSVLRSKAMRFNPFSDNKPLTNVVDLAADGNQTCALTKDGGVYCWGPRIAIPLNKRKGIKGSLWSLPRKMPLPKPARRIYVGAQSACAQVSASEVYCWGKNTGGMLGSSTSDYGTETPVLIETR